MATQYTAGLTSGQVLTAATMNSIGAAWETYTPSFTNATVGNGTVSAAYTQINKLVVGRVSFTLGSTSAVSNYVVVTVPIAAKVATYGGTVTYHDASPKAVYQGFFDPSSTTSGIVIGVLNSAGTYVVGGGMSSTVPFTWTTSDQILLNFYYEAA